MESWRARLAVLASRGEIEGPRVAEARDALSWWRAARFFAKEVERGALPEATAQKMLDLLGGGAR